MSVQKLIAEAEKLLDKKKPAEAIDRLKSALALEPLNQLVASRLANIYLEQNDRPSAARAHADLARRMGEAGKSAVAIALYKQAIDIQPDNMDLRVAYARECEEMGKVGDAQAQAQQALQHYLRRKKYLEAVDVMPLLARLSTRDDVKAAWIETIQLSGSEQKLAHLLVALCGPPGIISTEFNVGGDAASLSEPLYESLKSLVKSFPRDARLPYAIAWAAERRGKKRDFYDHLRESLRREPDFCLAYLMLARSFAEANRLSEALFVFKILKESLSADRSVDMSTLSRLVNSFVEKSPWITMGEAGGARDLEADEFLSLFAGADRLATATPLIEESPDDSPVELAETFAPAAAPALEAAPAPEPEPEPQPEPLVLFAKAPAPPQAMIVPTEPPVAPPPVSRIDIPAPPSAPPPIPAAEAAPEPAPSRDDSVEFTNIIKVEPSELLPEAEAAFEGLSAASPEPLAISEESADPSALLLQAESEAPAEAAGSPGKASFNPFAGLDAEPLSPDPVVREDKTEIFSPMDVLNAKDSARARFDHVQTKIIEENPAAPAPEAAAPAANAFVIGEATQIFSPMEAVAAAGESRRAPEGSPTISIEPSASFAPESGDATVVLTSPPQATDPDGATQVISAEQILPADLFAAAPVAELAVEPAGEAIADFGAGAPVISFQPIPDLTAPAPADLIPPSAPEAGEAAALAEAFSFAANLEPGTGSHGAEEMVDLGDDLLQEPTRVLVAPPPLPAGPAESTRHLLEEIRQEVRENKSGSPDADAMLRRAERYIVKQNYYLARKALRLSIELGADRERVQNRLRDIRKLELPTSLYHASSDDERERSSDILERLELEFDIRAEEEGEPSSESLRMSVSQQLDRIFRENDSRTILDFGVGLHEMGLYAQAEEVFTRITTEFPELSFDAYYLAAVAKFSRRDYAGAASILKHLSANASRSEEEKIQIYYTLGELFERMRSPERSREYFEKVAGLDANYRNVRHKLEG